MVDVERWEAQRELLLGLPSEGTEEDVYRLHQRVWSAVSPMMPQARERAAMGIGAPFLFARLSRNVVMVRSSRISGIAARKTSRVTEGARHRLAVDLVAVRGAEHDEEVPASLREQWVCATLEKAGFAVEGALELKSALKSGSKRDRESGRQLEIRLPTVHVKCIARVDDVELARQAMTHGIGRGRRFGFGMIRLNCR